MSQAVYKQDSRSLVSTAAYAAGEIIQLANGRAAVVGGLNAPASGDTIHPVTSGIHTVTKVSGVVILDGGRVYWDHSANNATFRKAGDRDFFIGTAVGDAASGDVLMDVDFNVRPTYLIDLVKDPFDTVVILSAGTPALNYRGALSMLFSGTAEAQKVDAISKDSFAVGSNWIVEGEIEVVTAADADVADLSVGVANATHATDAGAITESCFIHLDLQALNIFAESDDGTVEVAATDTTVDYAVGTRFHFVMDGRDESDVQIYVNGVNVLPSSVFDLSAATGPLKLLAHLEKTSNDSLGAVDIDALRVRIGQQ